MKQSAAGGSESWMREYWFASPHEAYTTGAAVVTCIDARFELTVRKLCRRWGIEYPDVIRIAGGPKALLSDTPAERDMLLEQLPAIAAAARRDARAVDRACRLRRIPRGRRALARPTGTRARVPS
jgi:hypothetical protein